MARVLSRILNQKLFHSVRPSLIESLVDRDPGKREKCVLLDHALQHTWGIVSHTSVAGN